MTIKSGGSEHLAVAKFKDRGSLEMRTMMRAGKIWFGAAVALMAAGMTPAAAQELSDKSVATLMEYAWSLVPAQFSQPDGKVIITDKKKKETSVVAIDVAKEVIKVARISAHAQACNMPEEQLRNHRALMKREDDKKTWTPQQMLYINQLHLVTVMLLTGKVKVTDKDGNKEVSIQADQTPSQTCSAEEAAKIKGLIDTFVNTAAAPAPAGIPAAAPVAAAAPAEKK